MEFAPVSDLSDTPVGVGPAAGGVVHVEAVDVAGLSDDGLSLRLGVLGRAESRLAAMKAQVLAEVGRRHSKGDAQRMVRNELQASKREAKRDVETAARLAELPTTSDALESGEIPVGHARLIARASSESPIDEELLVEAAGTEPFDEFSQTVKRHQRDVADDDGQAVLDRQRSKRKARIFESSDSGMFVLSGEFDQITGARIATALTAKERQLWHREDPKERATPQQRMADALAELICEPAGDVNGQGRSAGTDLLVIADFDVIGQQLGNPRLADGSPIPIVELHRLALEANLLPSIFDTKAQDLWLGRRLRTATEAQRVALIARDQHCIGCGANPLWCRAHHITWWSKNGPTDLDNLVLVCDDCHHKIHDHGWQVHRHPDTGKYHLKPPNPADIADTTRPTQHARSSPATQNGATRSSAAQKARSSLATRNGASRSSAAQKARSSPATPTGQPGRGSGSRRAVAGVVESVGRDRVVGTGQPEREPGNRSDPAGAVKPRDPERSTRKRAGQPNGVTQAGDQTGDKTDEPRRNQTAQEPNPRSMAAGEGWTGTEPRTQIAPRS